MPRWVVIARLCCGPAVIVLFGVKCRGEATRGVTARGAAWRAIGALAIGAERMVGAPRAAGAVVFGGDAAPRSAVYLDGVFGGVVYGVLWAGECAVFDQGTDGAVDGASRRSEVGGRKSGDRGQVTGDRACKMRSAECGVRSGGSRFMRC